MATLTLTAAANAAAQFLGVLDSGESLSTQQIADALAIANDLLDNWSSNKLYILQSLVQQFNLVAAQQSYTIGTGANFNVTRPMNITAAHLILAAGPSGPINVVNALQWSKIKDRQSDSWLVEYLFYDRANPTGKVWLSPVPKGGTVELTMWSALSQFADATTPLTMLPGYQRLLKVALAVDMAPQYDVQPSETLMAMYKDALVNVQGLNADLLGPEGPAEGTEVPPAMATSPQQ
jgi:hypothetical protein